MILLAAVLVLAAIGLLAAGLIEGSATLQWASFAASALAALVVVTGEVRRNLAARQEADRAEREPAGPPSRSPAVQQAGQPYEEPYDEQQRYDEPERYDERYAGSDADQSHADQSYAAGPYAAGPHDDRPHDDRPYTDQAPGAQPYQAADDPSSGARAAQPPYDLTPPPAGTWDRPHELFGSPWDGARQPAGATAYEPPPHVPPPTPPADDDTSLLPPAASDPVRHGAQDAGPAQTSPATDADGEPPVEEVEVTDLLVVLDLTDEVLVVDEHPRYHLAGCPHVSGEVTFAMPMVEARTDGFTPCGTCAPDRNLARVERARRARG